jgi:hypothetical protein
MIATVALVATAAVSYAQGTNSDRYTKRDVSNIISKLERTSNSFRRDFDKHLDNSSLNGTSEEDRINRIVSSYEAALDRLRREFDRNDNWWQSRRNVREVMDEARAVNQMMNNLQFARKLENQWRNMRRDINTLADTYDLAGLDSTGGGNIGSNVPSWAIGTFYGRNPQTGGRIQLTINPNGSVNADFDGAPSFGTLNGTLLTMGDATARVSRITDGIRTTRTESREYIDYFRNDPNFGGTGSGNWTNGNPDKWTIGTWYGRNPQTGGTIRLFIESNGRVTITMDNGTVTYASMDRDRLNNNGLIARVTKLKDGLRTTRIDNGDYIDYWRYNYYDNNPNNSNVQQGDVPDWAIGTFYGRNPQNGGNITLTVQKSGSVTVNMDGNISYGSMYKTTFTVNGETARVSKISNGFRMTNNRTGERIEYRRQ